MIKTDIMVTAILVDDEFKVRSVLKTLIGEFCPDITIVAEASNIKEAATLIGAHHPDVVFLDIEMPGGNGFELLSQFSAPSFETVFVTSYGHYALRAIKYSALDYLMKPVIISDLISLSIKISSRVSQKLELQQYRILQGNLERTHPDKLIVNCKNKLECVALDEIQYLQADGNYTTIFLEGRPKLYVAKTLKEYEDLLCENKGYSFLRIHKACIVNQAYISKVDKDLSTCVIMKDGTKLEISRRRKQEVLASIGIQQ
jgi:two-component system LytT family response regulator